MAKKPPRPRDANALAKRIVDLATGEAAEPEGTPEKHSKRGDARAAKLTPKRRSEIAKKAAKARWKKEG